MKKWMSLLLMALMVTAVFTGCSDGDKEVLYVYNWGDYIDEDVLDIFEEETGIRVVYETYATNEEMYTKISRGGTHYDIAIPSEYMIEKMIRENLLEPVDLSKITNYGYIKDSFKNLSFDPNNQYSVPYFWGTVGIIYNTELIDGVIDSWDVLWDPQYAGLFTMMDSQRDSIMVALKKLGYSMNTHDLSELQEAQALLIEQKPLVLAYAGDNVKDMLISGEAAMAVVWSGEASAVIQEYPQFEYILPKEGSNLWYDNIVIPKGSKNIENAHKFIDFLCRPDIAFMNADYVGYSTVNSEVMEMLDAELKDTTYAYPKQEWIENFEIFNDPGDFIKEYDRIWTEVKVN